MTELSSGSLADQALLDKIDKLFTCGVGELVDLPQLVVVGDQSSGKSSVLEGLTQLPFPRDKELCTRFATQITFRRSPVEETSASIIPSPTATDEHKNHVKAWSRPDLKNLAPKDFADTIRDVQERMGLNKDSTGGTKANFSEDIFKIEISGPTQDHLSIVDVPGIFRTPEAGKTTQADVDMVRKMVRGYMANRRSVLLTVVPAMIDPATQEIMAMAEEFDKEGIRHIGVLTKPDLVDRGAEQSVLDMINGIRYPLALGWQILRNTGQADLNKEGHDRDAAELTFFSEQAPWNTLESDKFGIQSLRRKLQDILARHIKREFPNVRNEISKKLNHAAKSLHQLGAQRSNAQEQREFLTKISIEFERLVNDALQKRYNSEVFERNQALRLPTNIINRQDVFAKMMVSSGHEYAFDNDMKTGSLGFRFTSPKPAEGSKNDPSMFADTKTVRVKADSKYPELEDITGQGSDFITELPKMGIMSWLNQQHTQSRGFELGSIDNALLATVLRAQTVKWVDLAHGYVSDVINFVHAFIKTSLETVVTDPTVREALADDMRDSLHAKYKKAVQNATFLLDVEREGLPVTANHYFNDNLQKSRAKRYEAAVAGLGSVHSGSGDSQQRLVTVEQLRNSFAMSNKEHDIRDFHDILSAYYKVAMKRFVDCVSQQAALWHLVTGPDSPLKLFSAAYVSQLTDEKLNSIAGEDPMLKQRRKALQNKIEKLEEGKKILV